VNLISPGGSLSEEEWATDLEDTAEKAAVEEEDVDFGTTGSIRGQKEGETG